MTHPPDGPPDGPGAPAEPPYGQPSGQPPYGQAPYGQPAYGQPFGAPGGPSRGTNGMAIASLVCAFLCTPLGLVFGFIARNQIKQTGEKGDGLAIAGIVISALSIVLGIALVASNG